MSVTGGRVDDRQLAGPAGGPGPDRAGEERVIDFSSVTKWFVKDRRRIVAISDVDLSVRRNEFLSVVGPSGCGKSTLLNLAAGLMAPNRGHVEQSGVGRITGVNTTVGYITQNDNLLPWSTVAENVGLALRIRGLSRADRRERTRRYLDKVGLQGFEHHYPAELSGGMRKRASLARTLIYDPQILLMDEPFSALDAQVKLIMHRQLLQLLETEARTILFITHDLDEAITLSDRVAIMSARPGRIKKIVDIPIQRPRDPLTVRRDPLFQGLYEQLWEGLKDDIDKGTDV